MTRNAEQDTHAETMAHRFAELAEKERAAAIAAMPADSVRCRFING
jgi:hypothetical protein